MMDALYLILQIEGGLGLFTTTYDDGRLVFNSTDRGRFGLLGLHALYLILHIEGGLGLFTTTYDGRLVSNSTYRGGFGLIYNYL